MVTQSSFRGRLGLLIILLKVVPDKFWASLPIVKNMKTTMKKIYFLFFVISISISMNGGLQASEYSNDFSAEVAQCLRKFESFDESAFKKAKEHCSKAVSLYVPYSGDDKVKKRDDRHTLSSIQYKLASYSYALGEIQESRDYFSKAINNLLTEIQETQEIAKIKGKTSNYLREKLSLNRAITISFKNLGDTYESCSKEKMAYYDKAAKYSLYILQDEEVIGDINRESEVCAHKGKVCELGNGVLSESEFQEIIRGKTQQEIIESIGRPSSSIGVGKVSIPVLEKEKDGSDPVLKFKKVDGSSTYENKVMDSEICRPYRLVRVIFDDEGLAKKVIYEVSDSKVKMFSLHDD